MSIEAVKRTLTEAKRHERHRTVAETRYWCDQYKQIATEAVKALAKQEQPFADKAASVSNDRIKIDSVTGNVQIGAAKQEQGWPVAWMMLNSSGDEISITESNLRHHQPAFVQELWKDATPLYTTPQQRKPLTDEQKQLKFMKWGLVPANQSWGIQDWFYAGIAYAEAAHGITSATDFKE